MKIATAAYPLDWLDSWAQYEDKLAHWVSEAAGQGADLLVFPEYGAMELSTLAGPAVAADLEGSIRAVSERMEEAATVHLKLAAEHGVHILGASAPVDPGAGRPVNRAELYTPAGGRDHQDKQIMTRFEREDWDIVPGGPLKLFNTALGRIGVLICYDSEFPLLGRALSEADILLVPSCTEALAGYSRVRIGAMARALENQCVTAMASLVGDNDWSEAVDRNTGMGGIFGPPDKGFPGTGILAEGQMNRPGWTYAEVDLSAIAHVRADGGVLNRSHWVEQDGRVGSVTNSCLRAKAPLN
ncbi:carbon-nitrogen hydrolase family protein [Ruegeria pomeroyi]|uniref:Carbon-nitrogen hydrolase family protein n=1 Tax=Ruegeria alba TaxID=2916756 RepID=A0ABS9NZD7_9RHOB|nr:carbon-nitrogen hydrolase family protein [Ruegeria alba]MCE8514098.1 carbon-nitrogen hydrolase family protein [Ruegeria pomeroyi]MCE8522115.1 carbon-nitrogen hydrolase family protein [Ruegeria pomeroyi]MCE8530824.1 carbon-nitrogen hydrolase family protein [Ruegeria pomeroyi]MCG6559576.1 carbon-nitrogen hydrolase family protein [Ruegeria alba]